MSQKYELRESIKKSFEHTEDFAEPQTRKSVHDYQMCPEFVMRTRGIPLPLGCYFCRYGKFSYSTSAEVGQTGTCYYPEVITL